MTANIPAVAPPTPPDTGVEKPQTTLL